MRGPRESGLYIICAQNQEVLPLFLCLRFPIQELARADPSVIYCALKYKDFGPKIRVTVL